jgi:catechol 2,3-dioxygenase-like lactoylglutathione lyase family enzyme
MAMLVKGIDHVNILTEDLARTAAFYADVLGLRAGDPPANLDPAQIQWMFQDDGHPVFHLSRPGSLLGEDVQAVPAGHTGAVHHVALECTDYDAMIGRLTALGVEHSTNHVPAIGLGQIFVRDPNGVLLELNFPSGRAEGAANSPS